MTLQKRIIFYSFLQNTQLAQQSPEICCICARDCNTPFNLFIFEDHN